MFGIRFKHTALDTDCCGALLPLGGGGPASAETYIIITFNYYNWYYISYDPKPFVYVCE